MDFGKVSGFDMSSPARDVDIVDRKGKKIGLTLTLLSDTDPKYTRVRDKIQHRMTQARLRGRSIKPAENESMEQELAAARIGAIKVAEPFKSTVGEVAHNKTNVIRLLFELGEFSSALRKQVDEAVRNMAEDFFDD